MSAAKLVPLLDVDDDNDRRPTLRIFPDTPMILGRNKSTSIELLDVSRELLKVEWRDDDNKLYAIPLKEEHFIKYQNEFISCDELILKHGDIISLYHERYSYQIRYSETKASELSSTAKRKLTDHVACPICMELMVDIIMLLPCAHRFCRSCCAGATECATCRTSIASQMPDKFLTGLVEDLVQEKCLDTDDCNMYRQRTGKEPLSEKALSSSPTSLKPAQKRRRRRPPPSSSSAPSQIKADPEVIVLS